MPDLRSAERLTRRMLAIEKTVFTAERTAYRDFRLEMREVISRTGASDPSLVGILERNLGALEREVTSIRGAQREQISQAARIYANELSVQLRSLGVRAPDPPPGALLEADLLIALALAGQVSWILTARGRMLSELNRLRVTGEDPLTIEQRLFSPNLVQGRVSAWRAGLSSLELGEQLVLWSAAMGAAGKLFAGVEEQAEERLGRQAVAAIDERTTDCCLRVHGQIIPFDERFHLTGTPRFADYVQNPPFHWHCRTATAVYHPLMEQVGVPTETMKKAARAELEARQRTGRRVEIHPAHATSGRGT